MGWAETAGGLAVREHSTAHPALHLLINPAPHLHTSPPSCLSAPQDYLAAPMPYLVGIQAECLPLLRGMALEEVVLIDLDRLGSCTPELGSPGDDYWALPFAAELEDVFEVGGCCRAAELAGLPGWSAAGEVPRACGRGLQGSATTPNQRSHLPTHPSACLPCLPALPAYAAGGERPHQVAHRV